MPRKAKISRREILQAALDLVDHDGLDALSMRKLGEKLGVEAMSLYRHVPNKEALLDGIHEEVLAEMRLSDLCGDWVEDLKALVYAFREVLRAHPKIVPLFARRPAITQGSLEYIELALDILSTPFPDVQTRTYAFQTLISFVVGHSMGQFASQVSTGPEYEKLPSDEFPILSTLNQSLKNYSSDAEFNWGLNLLLQGFHTKHRPNTD